MKNNAKDLTGAELDKPQRFNNRGGLMNPEANGLYVRYEDFVDLIAQARAQQESAAPAEELVRFCPHCACIGEIGAEYRDCCPDGSAARRVPRKLAEVCRDTFKLAIDGASQPPAPMCPTCKGNDANAPCAYPGEGRPGCLRDARIAAAPEAAHAGNLPPTKFSHVMAIAEEYGSGAPAYTVDEVRALLANKSAHAQQDAAQAELIALLRNPQGVVSRGIMHDAMRRAADLLEKHAAVAPSDATGKADAANAGGLTEKRKEADHALENLADVAHAHGKDRAWIDEHVAAVREAFPRPATSAADAKDAERWRKALLHVGGCYCSEGVRFTLRGLAPIKDANIMKGSVAQHFTEAIDAAIAVQQAQSSAMGGDV